MKAPSSQFRGALAALFAAGLLSAPAMAQGQQAQPTRSPVRQTGQATQSGQASRVPSQTTRAELGRRIDERRIAAARNAQQAESQRAQQSREQQAREQQSQQQREQNARQNQQAEANRAENARQEQQRAENARQQENAPDPRAAQARSQAQSVAVAKEIYSRVNQHRDRLARLDRLTALFQDKNEARKLSQIEQMRQREVSSFEKDMTRMREQIGPDMYARVRAALDDPAGTRRAREAGSTDGSPRQRGQTPPAENTTPRGGGL